MRRIAAFILSILCTAAWSQNGQNLGKDWLSENYTKREVMIPMRDGVRLYTAVYEPAGTSRKCPVMLVRTPYSLKPYGIAPGRSEGENVRLPYGTGFGSDVMNYVADGYVIVYQNVRGRYLSEGDFENIRPLLCGEEGGAVVKKDAGGNVIADDATDVYDTVEWILANTENNGNVGVKGVSYPGFYATLAILSRHPAIKAVSPQAPVTDWFMGDDAHHNGALCLTDSYRFGSSMYREDRKCPSPKGLPALFKSEEDIYEYFRGRSIKDLSAFFGDSLAFWSRMMEHPDYDEFWISRDPSLHLSGVRPAVMVTGGFYDAEDCYGAFRTYEMIRKLSPETELYLAAGPWYHGGWNSRTADHIADAWFGEASGAWYQDNVEYPFFRHYLEGTCDAPARVNVLPSGETCPGLMDGVPSDGMWKTYSEWPPENAVYRAVRLTPDESLDCSEIISGQEPRRMKGSRSYVSDPSCPVPYMDIRSSSRDRNYMAADQSFACDREDVLSYCGPVLADTVHVAGKIVFSGEVCLSSAYGRELDGDIVVKLIDVRPDGYRMLVRGDVMPLRYRNGFGSPEPVRNGKYVSVSFEMPEVDHYFMPGHCLMVQVQGSWFPLIAMNPQTYITNQHEASSGDYRPVTVTVRAGRSSVLLPVCE